MLIGYKRVSTNDGSQTFNLQKEALIAAGIQEDRVYQDLVTGKKEARPGLQAYLKALQPGNTLVVWKLDRLGPLRMAVAAMSDPKSICV
jgi:DNA invertase Pin-like site-specific DNA recombinase